MIFVNQKTKGKVTTLEHFYNWEEDEAYQYMSRCTWSNKDENTEYYLSKRHSKSYGWGVKSV